MVTAWTEIGLELVFRYVTVPRSVSPATTLVLSRVSGVEITSPPAGGCARVKPTFGPLYQTPLSSWYVENAYHEPVGSLAVNARVALRVTKPPGGWSDGRARVSDRIDRGRLRRSRPAATQR